MATKSPNFISIYNGVDKREHSNSNSIGKEAIEAAGGGFSVGTVVGSLYHFGKALLRKEGTLIAGVNAARAYGPRFGGTFALVYMPVDITRYAIYQYYPHRFDMDDDSSSSCLFGDIACWAAIGALLRAPRGLASAFRSALVWAAVPGAITASHYSLLNNNNNPQRQIPYSYPHYRLHHHQQQQQQRTIR